MSEENKFLPKLKEILAAEKFPVKQALILSNQMHYAEGNHYVISDEEDKLWMELIIKITNYY